MAAIRATVAIGSNNEVERMRTILSIANLLFPQRRRTSVPLSEAIPFWFAVSSPLIGLGLGVFGAWFVTLLTS
jgi:hypothetical protein